MTIFPKPEPRATTKRRQQRQQAAARKRCVEAIWKRDRSLCVLCHRAVQWRPLVAEIAGHVDEIVPRSLGGNPTDPDNCRLLCQSCHMSGPSGAHRVTVRP